MEIACLMHNINRYTGGRYLFWQMAYALKKLGHDVTVYTDQPAGFITNDFRDREAPQVRIVGRKDRYSEPEADLYIGLPIIPNKVAVDLAHKHGKKALCWVFDSKPALKEVGFEWEELPDSVPYLNHDDVYVLSLAEANIDHIQQWTGASRDRIKVVYPCVNDIALKKAGETKPKKDNLVVFVSRLVEYKHLDHLMAAAEPLGLKVAVVSSDRDDRFKNVSWHIRVDDVTKFVLLLSARVVCVPATYEGSGMWAMEAWAAGVPVVTYDLPTVREMDPKATYFAKLGDKWDLQRQLIRCLSEGKKVEPDKRFYFGRMMKRMDELLNEIGKG